MKYDKKIVENICRLISTDSYTIPEICRQVGIAKSTYHEWESKKPEFSDCIKKAKNDFNELVIVEAKKSLMKKIRGYMEQEKKTITVDTGKRDEEGKPIVRVKEHVVADKYFQPDTAAIIFALTNRDPENWKNRINNEITGKDGKDLTVEPVTIEIIDSRDKVDAKDTNDSSI
jgi:transcriptional regulator with XRE-family HTH domain